MGRAIDADAYVEDLKDLYEKLKNISGKCESIRDKEIALLQMSLLSECVLILTEQPTIEPKQEWISVKDRLPEKGQGVLCFCAGNLANFYMWTGEEWEDSYGYYEYDDIISHWMPLPEPPEKNNEEEQA